MTSEWPAPPADPPSGAADPASVTPPAWAPPAVPPSGAVGPASVTPPTWAPPAVPPSRYPPPHAYSSAPYPGPPAHWTTAPPPPLSDVPRRAVRPRHGWVLALTGVVAVVVLGLVVTFALPEFAHLQVPGRAPGASVPSGKASATPSPRSTSSPTPSTTPTMPTDPKVVLRKNPVYALAVPASCPPQRPPASAAAFRRQVNALVACENAAWKKALARTPVTFRKPRTTFYGSSTESPCGALGSRFPAAYCSVDRTLYFSTAAYRQGRYYRLAVAQFVMHEYAHHVQELAGIFPSSWAASGGRAVTTRRIELQAHCMAHYGLTHSGIDFGSRDRADAEYQFSYTNDAAGHGSVAAERYWGRRGLEASTIGACNTWTVAASKVK